MELLFCLLPPYGLYDPGDGDMFKVWPRGSSVRTTPVCEPREIIVTARTSPEL